MEQNQNKDIFSKLGESIILFLQTIVSNINRLKESKKFTIDISKQNQVLSEKVADLTVHLKKKLSFPKKRSQVLENKEFLQT